jgi:phage terminase large subunit-like protein
VRLAAGRFLADLERCRRGTAPFVFDAWHATDPCEFIEKLPHVEGKWTSPTIKLHASHVFFVVALFGFRMPDGSRRFSSALLAVARKNAKSTLFAGILLYCLCCEDEVGPQVITAATTGQQARMIFNIAKRMVEMTPDLREAFGLEPFANSIANWQVGGSLKPINAKASTQDGLNPSHTALDEIHAHKTHDLLNVLKSAAGARANALWLYATTEGYETPGPWPELRQFAQQLLQRAFEADHFLAILFAVDEDDEDFDESKWIKANPLIDVNPILEREIRKAAIEAKQMPGSLAEFRIKRLNRRSSSAKGFIDLTRWKVCGGAVNLEEMVGYPCWGGLDLSSTTDLTSLRLVWLKDGIFYTWGRRWVPAGAVAQRTERGTVPYAAWVEAGWLTVTDGEVVDYSVVQRDIELYNERFQPKEIAYDPWNATDLVNRLNDRQLPMVEFRQGPKSYHPAMQALERIYRSVLLRHGNDPVLTWCASNLIVRYDENMNMAPDKKRSKEKIDDVTALLMAIGRASVAPAQGNFGDMVVVA